MSKKDWYEVGDRIEKLVQDAVDSGNFSQLGTTISNIVNDTVDGLQSALRENLGPDSGQRGRRSQDVRERNERTGGTVFESDAGTAYKKGKREKTYTWEMHIGGKEDERDSTNSAAAERIRKRMQEKRQNPQVRGKDRDYKPVAVKIKAPGEISGLILKGFGYTTGGILGLSMAILLVVWMTAGFNMLLPISILALLCGTSFCLGYSGSRKRGLALRFKRYKQILGDRTYCLVEELATAVGLSCKAVRRDLKKMIGRGYFQEGYLDSKETLLITDRETYQQYLTAQTEYHRRELTAEERRAAQKHTAAAGSEPKEEQDQHLSPECRELIDEGKQYIRHIHECNERIPGREMSEKLERLEVVITKIFREAEKDPAVVADLKKMMSYYLPTTRKLLDAYCELEDQPIRGQNIEKTKKEIESALDTINTAFENLLDSFFEEKAWDISSDISVLNTMFAQEGLTGKDFEC